MFENIHFVELKKLNLHLIKSYPPYSLQLLPENHIPIPSDLIKYFKSVLILPETKVENKFSNGNKCNFILFYLFLIKKIY